jgi:hypothetical protein
LVKPKLKEGGYNPESWTSNNTFTSNEKTFLFQLGNDKGRNLYQIPSTSGKSSYAYGGSGYGPTFGGITKYKYRWS